MGFFSEAVKEIYTEKELSRFCEEFNCTLNDLEPYMAIKAYHDCKSPTADIDAETVLADVMSECNHKAPYLAEEIFTIWKNSSDKASVEALFHNFAGIEFRDYLDRVVCETPIKHIRSFKV